MKRRFTILTAALALLVSLAIPMGMWGQTRTTVTDQMTHADLAATGNTYTDFSNVSLESDAVYAGNSAREYANSQYNIQLRSKNSNSGIVTTTSGGTIKSITITVAHGTNTIDVYGKNTAYSAAADLYNSNNQGTKIGSLSSTGTINVTDSYAYVGIRSNNGAIYLSSIDFVWDEGDGSAVATTTTIDASNITNTDVYVSTTAGSLTATVTETESGDAISGATVTWTSSDTDVATIDNNGAVTLVAAGTTTITASYAGESGVYAISSTTYELTVTNSAPYVQPTEIEIIPNYTFWGKTGQFSGDTYSELEGSKDNVTLNWTKGSGSTYANSTAMRFYKDNNLTFTAPEGYEIISIALTVSGSYSDLTFSPTGFDNETTTWTGAAETVTMSRPSNADSYATISKFIITLGLPSTDPSITANGVTIPYDATSGSFNYTINNPVQGGYLTVDENESWISDPMADNGVVNFNTETNPNTVSREGIIRMRYLYDGEILTHNVTITQTAAPVIYSTIPALFAAATSTATNVNVTFGNWVVSGVSGSNVFVTDNDGNGFIIYTSNHGFAVNDKLSGTVMGTPLKLYSGSAEFTNLTKTTDGISVSDDGTITVITDKTIADLGGVNTGAVITLNNLTYDGTNLSDGTNTIKPYTTLYNGTFVNGKTYNVTGVYQQFNSTKEILPRSADDIEEVVVTTPIINAENVNIAYDATFGEIAYTITNPVDGQNLTATTTSEWISNITVTSDKVTFATTANDGNTDRTATITLSYNGATDKTITVTQGHYVAPVTGDKYVKVTSTTDLSSGQYLIVYAEGSVAFDGSLETLDAASNTIEVTINDSEIGITNITTASEFTIDVTAGTIMSASGYYIGQTSDANGLASSNTTAYTNTISFDEDGNANIVSGGAYLRYNSASNQTRFRYYKSSSYTNQKAIQLYKKVVAEETYTLDVPGYAAGSAGGYRLIASPVTVSPADVQGMILTDDDAVKYDLFYFDQSNTLNGTYLEWVNYKSGNNPNFKLVPGTGYLYAQQANTEGEVFRFTLSGSPYTGDGTISLEYDADARFAGWNLIGNPYATAATLDKPFYKMDANGVGLGAQIEDLTNTIAAMEGVFVQVNAEDGKSAKFTPQRQSNQPASIAYANIVVNDKKGSVLDNAIVRFDNGETLGKFQLNRNSTKVYFSENNNDYAIVRGEEMGAMPVNFKAENNGTYTLNVSGQNTEFAYLHLIDNMTGNDIDLLKTPSYSFEAKTTDYESRFKLVFATGDNSNDDTFAFYSNGSFVINNEGNAELQVIDIMGRIVKSESINGCANVSVNGAAGVYMLRLVNGDNVKTQKVVVK